MGWIGLVLVWRRWTQVCTRIDLNGPLEVSVGGGGRALGEYLLEKCINE